MNLPLKLASLSNCCTNHSYYFELFIHKIDFFLLTALCLTFSFFSLCECVSAQNVNACVHITYLHSVIHLVRGQRELRDRQ